MIWHPLLLSILLMDLLSGLLMLGSTVTALRIFLGWSAGTATRSQIRLEAAAEAGSMQTRAAVAIFCGSSLLLIFGIANELPGIVPGAMCGTGVIEALGGLGFRALGFRVLTFGLLAVWHVLDRLNRSRPEAPLTTLTARTVLLASPVFFMAAADTARALFALDVHQPVSCCTVVYDQVRALTSLENSRALPDSFWVWGFAVASALVLAAGLNVAWRGRGISSQSAGLLAGLSLAWAPLAALCLVKVFAAYHYGVLHHTCPWCLFLPEHHLAGYPLFAALAAVCLEGVLTWVSAKVADRYPQLAAAAEKRTRAAGRRVTLAMLLFWWFAVSPALLWRLRFGVWMG